MNDDNRTPSEWDGEPVGPTDEIPAGESRTGAAAAEPGPAVDMPVEDFAAESASAGAPRPRGGRWGRGVRRVVRRPSTRRGRGGVAVVAALALLLLGGGGGFVIAAETVHHGAFDDGGHGHHQGGAHGNGSDGADED